MKLISRMIDNQDASIKRLGTKEHPLCRSGICIKCRYGIIPVTKIDYIIGGCYITQGGITVLMRSIFPGEVPLSALMA